MEGQQVIEGCSTTFVVRKQGKEGGAVIMNGSEVTVHVTGVVRATNKLFWTTKDSGKEPFKFTAGMGSVISGWDSGCIGMVEGEVRQLLIPPAEGYSDKGHPERKVPPNAILNITLEVLSVLPPLEF